jgi:hypothetical protein
MGMKAPHEIEAENVRSLKLLRGLNSAAKDIFACHHKFGFPSLKFARREGYVQLGREGIFKLVVYFAGSDIPSRGCAKDRLNIQPLLKDIYDYCLLYGTIALLCLPRSDNIIYESA